MDEETELRALRGALRVMRLDPVKVAAFVASEGDYECKKILFACVGLDEAKLIAHVGEGANMAGWREFWNGLLLPVSPVVEG